MTGTPHPGAWIAALAPLVAAGCVDYDLTRYQGVDLYNQNPAEQVDVLLVVDNSGSMQPYQQQLGTSFDSFISYFIGANVNYHIGVVTTDAEVADAGAIRGEVITPDTPDPAAVFSQIVNVGITGSGFEMGLEAGLLALTEPRLSTSNLGFLREDASLSVIFVSDEEDSSPFPVAKYINRMRDVKGQRARDVFNASALVVTDVSTCSGDAQTWSAVGTRYMDVAAQTDGITGNLCSEYFEEIVVDLSLNVSRLTDTFLLGDWPDVSTLLVSVDEVEIPCNAGEWTYTVLEVEGVETPAVVFDRDFLPDVGARIAIRYDYGEGDPANFCTSGGNSEPTDTDEEA